MPDQEMVDWLRFRFGLWRQLEPAFHRVCTLEEKFGPLLHGRYGEVVTSLAGVLETRPERHHKRLARRHREKEQRAALLLAENGFKDALCGLARQWALDRRVYEVDRTAFYFREGQAGRMCWETCLLWLSIEYLRKWGAQEQQEERRLADRYSADLDFQALERGKREARRRLPINRFAYEVREFTRRFGLSGLWDESVETLLLSGRLLVPHHDCRLVLKPEEDRTRLFLEVFPETRKEDIEHKWAAANASTGSDDGGAGPSLLQELFGARPRRRLRPQLDRDLQTQQELAKGRKLKEQVAEDYAPEGGYGAPAEWDEFCDAEPRLIEAFGRGRRRIGRVQAEALHAAVEASVPEWLRATAEETLGRRTEEWHL